MLLASPRTCTCQGCSHSLSPVRLPNKHFFFLLLSINGFLFISTLFLLCTTFIINVKFLCLVNKLIVVLISQNTRLQMDATRFPCCLLGYFGLINIQWQEVEVLCPSSAMCWLSVLHLFVRRSCTVNTAHQQQRWRGRGRKTEHGIVNLPCPALPPLSPSHAHIPSSPL